MVVKVVCGIVVVDVISFLHDPNAVSDPTDNLYSHPQETEQIQVCRVVCVGTPTVPQSI